MTPMSRVWLALGSVGMSLAVVMGAFGAHALKKVLAPDLVAIYETAVYSGPRKVDQGLR